MIAEFVLSQVNSQTCPENYIPITDSHECDSDMELLELQDSPHGSFLEIKSAPEQKRYPELPGCLYSFSSGSVKFNTKTSADRVERWARRICRLMPPCGVDGNYQQKSVVTYNKRKPTDPWHCTRSEYEVCNTGTRSRDYFSRYSRYRDYGFRRWFNERDFVRNLAERHSPDFMNEFLFVVGFIPIVGQIVSIGVAIAALTNDDPGDDRDAIISLVVNSVVLISAGAAAGAPSAMLRMAVSYGGKLHRVKAYTNLLRGCVVKTRTVRHFFRRNSDAINGAIGNIGDAISTGQYVYAAMQQEANSTEWAFSGTADRYRNNVPKPITSKYQYDVALAKLNEMLSKINTPPENNDTGEDRLKNLLLSACGNLNLDDLPNVDDLSHKIAYVSGAEAFDMKIGVMNGDGWDVKRGQIQYYLNKDLEKFVNNARRSLTICNCRTHYWMMKGYVDRATSCGRDLFSAYCSGCGSGSGWLDFRFDNDFIEPYLNLNTMC